MDKKAYAFCWGIAFTMAVHFLLGTGLVEDWGYWYSKSVPYRLQTEAMLSGRIALASSPSAVEHDMIWANGGVQQPWGLGVPVWRLPFEAMAKLFGQPAFPDRLAFGVALTCVLYAVFRVLVLGSDKENSQDQSSGLKRFFTGILALLLLAFFPPFLTLCRFRFNVYEEAVAYAYLVGIVLFVATLHFVRKPKISTYAMLSLFAGLVPFVRPTLLFYSIATVLTIWIHSRRLGWNHRKSWLGLVPFACGGGLLFLANYQRFGSGFEFGHALNLNRIDPLRFAMRFDHPFQTEPLISAAKELFSCLFLSADQFNGYDWYRAAFFPGQSTTLRWREIYFTTFGLGCSVMLLVAWGAFLKRQSRKSAEIPKNFTSIEVMALWSLAASALLTAFYLRCPCIASRYMVDFAPAFAVGIFAFANMALNALEKRFPHRPALQMTCFAGIACWWGFQVLTAKSRFPSDKAIGQAQAVNLARRDSNQPQPLPSAYVVGMNLDSYGIQRNGLGWKAKTGETKAAVAFFVNSPHHLELLVSPAEGVQIASADYDHIRVKIGLEELNRRNNKEVSEGRILTFGGPVRHFYQKGAQVAFIGFVKPNELGTNNSAIRLLRVGWSTDAGAAELLVNPKPESHR